MSQFAERNGFPPTLQEIGDGVGLANPNAVRGHLAALEKKGWITRVPDKARSIRVVGRPSAASDLKRRLHDLVGTDRGVAHRVVYGLAWTTARGGAGLSESARRRVSGAIEREAVEHGWEVIRLSVGRDRVVSVVRTWPNHSAAQTVRRLKAAAAAAARHGGEKARGRLWEQGYVVTTDLSLFEGMVAELPASRSGSSPAPDAGAGH